MAEAAGKLGVPFGTGAKKSPLADFADEVDLLLSRRTSPLKYEGAPTRILNSVLQELCVNLEGMVAPSGKL